MLTMLRRTALCLSFVLVSACSNASHGNGAVGTAPATPPATPAPSAAPAAPAKPTADAYANTAYATTRRALLAAGWLPLRTPECRTNVGGEATVCNTLPETDSCSGDGHCLMRFANPASSRTLTLHAYGDYDRWSAPNAGFMVMSSDTAPAASPTAAACPAPTFDAFLRAFAASPSTRAAFTAPIVRASEVESDSEGDRLVPVAYTAAAYPGFNVTHDGRAFHHVDAAGQTDPAPLALDVTDGATGPTVRYDYGSTEGRAYRFERAGDCWRLVEQLPPALD